MISFIDHYFCVSDLRGSITGLVNFGEWREFNLVKSNAGVSRGNHYHKQTEEGFIILEGRIQVVCQEVLSGIKQTHEVTSGDVFIISKMVCHQFIVIEPSVWINFLSEPMDSQNPDFYRLDINTD